MPRDGAVPSPWEGSGETAAATSTLPVTTRLLSTPPLRGADRVSAEIARG